MVEGPSVLAAEIGVLKILKVTIILDKLARQRESNRGVEQSGFTIRKFVKDVACKGDETFAK